MSASSKVHVDLFDSEVIAGRGRKKTQHWVRRNDGWVRAAEFPNARVTLLDSGPGTVWERRIELELGPGTRVLRVVSEPGRERRRDALEHLVRAKKSPERRTRRVELEVGSRGNLIPIATRKSAVLRRSR